MRKLFALLMALTMTFQLVTPAWADVVEELDETTEAAVEVVEDTEEPTEEVEEVPEETEAETEETEAETTEGVEETEEPELVQEEVFKLCVHFECTPEDLTLVVYPADGDVDQAIEAEEDGTYLLAAGEYEYVAEAKGYSSIGGALSIPDDGVWNPTFDAYLIEIFLEKELGMVQPYESDDSATTVSTANNGDLTPPQLVSISCSPSVVTVPGAVHVTVKATDDLSGVDFASLSFFCEENGKQVLSFIVNQKDENGDLAGDLKLDAYFPEGEYTLKDVLLFDKTENVSRTIPDNLRGVMFTVADSTQSDLTPPVLQNVVCSPSIVSAPGEVEIKVEASDNLSGIDFASLSFYCKETGKRVSSVIVNQKDESGNLLGKIKFGNYYPAGDYTLSDVLLFDKAGNTSRAIPESCEGILFTIDNTQASDIEPPELINMFCTPSRLDVPGEITIEVEATDNLSGVQFASVVFYCEETGKRINSVIANKVNEKGNLVGTLKLNQFFPEGAYSLKEILIFDNVNNVSRHIPDELKRVMFRVGGAVEEHEMELVPSKEPSCTEAGNNAYYICKICSAVFKDADGLTETTVEAETLPAFGHDMTKTEATEPTYWETGNNTYYTCSRCGKVFQDEAGESETTVEVETLEKLPSVAVGECGESLLWALTKEGTLVICGNGSMPDYGQSSNVAPWFSRRAQIQQVEIGTGVTNIGANAFYSNVNCTAVMLPDGLQKIGESAFEDCGKLKEVVIPSSVVEIERRAFYDCGTLTAINIPNGLTGIEEYVFYGCSALTSVTVPESVKSIGEYAFYDCDGMVSVTLTEGLSNIGSYAFQNCGSLRKVSIPATVTQMGDYVFADCGSLTSAEIPASLENTWLNAYYAFYHCGNLTDVRITDGATFIASSMFGGCSSLKSISIPESVQTIGNAAFMGCTSLENVNIPDGVTKIEGQVFADCKSLRAIAIPDHVSEIDRDAFNGCTSLVSVNIPDSVIKIEGWTFKNCSSLESLDIPQGIIEIGQEAFAGCSSLKSLTILDGVRSIGERAFAGCSGFTSMDIPESVTSIGRGAFLDCTGLTEVNIAGKITCVESETFCNCTSLRSITLPDGVLSIADRIDVWSPDETPYGAPFENCVSLESVGIPASVASIGVCAFGGCTGLKNVYYNGTDLQWRDIQIEDGNENLTNATIHYSSTHVHKLKYINKKASTCTEPGYKEYWLCLVCGDFFTSENCTEKTDEIGVTIPALGHSMTLTEANPATCTEDGNNRYYTCGSCHKLFQDAEGEKETTLQAETLPAFGHTVTRVETVAPTCTEAGNRVYYICKTCQKAFKDKQASEATTVEAETLPALGHIMTKTEAVAPTHTAPGSNAYYTCNTCHKVFRDEKGTTETTPEQEVLPQLPGIADGKSGALTWLLSDDGTLTISGKGRMPDYSGSALAPWYDYKDQIQTVVVEEGVLSVGAYAFFDCENLSEIQLPGSVKQLGKECFEGCDSLGLLDMSGVPGTAEEKITDLQGLAELDASIKNLVGNNTAFHWELETVSGEADAKTLAKLAGTKLEVLQSGKFRLVCTEDYTGLTGSAEMEVQLYTVIRPEEREWMISGETLELSSWSMPFETELSASWSLGENSEAYASVSDSGVLTAKNVATPVEITVRAEPVNGEAAAEKTIRILPKAAELLILADGELAGETLTVDFGEKQTLSLTAQIKPEGALTTVAWTSDAPEVASIDEDGTVTLLKPGTAVIRAASTDGGASAQLTLQLIPPRDKSPRLASTTLTLNSNLTAGITTALVESYNNTIQSVTLYDYNKSAKRYESTPSASFAAEAEDGTLTVRALGAQKNGTYQLKLVVDCLGGSYDYTLQVKVANSLPKVTVKQVGKFDTFYLDSTAQLTATAAGCQVERLELTGTNTFRMDEDGNLFYAESYNPGDKVVTKGTLRVYLEGYQVPVQKAVTVTTTKTAPKLTLNPAASAVNTALGEAECRAKVLWKGEVLDLTDADVTNDVGFATVETQGEYLVFRLKGTTGGTAKLGLRLPGWAQAVSLSHKVTVENKLPTVKLGTSTLKLNSLFTAKTARTSVWLTQGNLDIGTMEFAAAKAEGEKIALSFDPETDSIEARFNEVPKAGTYSYTYTAYLENGTALKSGTLKVTVAATAPKVKLSAASVKLNRYLAGQEAASVKVTVTGGSGYQVTDLEGLPEYMSYDAETGKLTVVLPDGSFTGETRTLYPILRDEESGQEVRLNTKLTLKVQTVNTSKLTVSLSAKGKLDTVKPDSAIAYTVTKVSNCLAAVENVDLIGQDGNLFQAELDTSGAKPVVLLRLLPGESYATNKTYKVQFRFNVCGREVNSSVLSVKVSQTALKVTGPKSAVYYLSQSGPMRCSLTANVPLESVSLSAKTAKEFREALGGEENLRLIGSRVEFQITNPGALKAGKSYSVQLELMPENAAANTKPTILKLTVKVMK